MNFRSGRTTRRRTQPVREWAPVRQREEDAPPPPTARRSAPERPRALMLQAASPRAAVLPKRQPLRLQPQRLVFSLQAVDFPLLAVLATLLALGLVMVYSASMLRSQLVSNQPAYFFTKQIMWIGLGLGIVAVMLITPYRWWQKLAIPVMGVALLLLVAVLVFGKERYGAERTLLNGSLQPSEFAKLAVVIYVSAWVASKKDQLARVEGGLIPFAILMGIVAGLLVLEPSFSVAIIILVTGVTIFFVGGGSARQLAITGAIAAVVLGLLVWQSGYGETRIRAWQASLTDPSKAPYDVAQAMAIIRRGHGIDTSQDNWLLKASVPLLWSDYLFANVGADLGFPGTLAVVVLFAALGYRGLTIALNAPDQFGALAAIGITTWMLTQALIHIGASLALIPTTGVPLPFMSYGGSSMLANMAAIGLLLSISRASPEKRAPYAHFGFGGWHRRPRLPNPRRSRSATADKRTASPAPTRRPRAAAGRAERRTAGPDPQRRTPARR